MEITKFYGGQDPREIPLYSVMEAARFIRLPSSTLTDWVQGHWRIPGTDRFASPIIQVSKDNEGRLSFNNLVEAFVLKTLRRAEGLSMHKVRQAVWHAREELGIDRPFLSRKLAASGDLFLHEEGGLLVNISRASQLALEEIMRQYLTRVEWDEENDLPVRLYPYIADFRIDPTIVIDPTICFGQPTIAGHGIITSVIIDRINAGEKESDIARDYGIKETLLKDVVLYEMSKA